MPLVWAHAEHIKLLRSIRDGKIFDMPPQTVDRYLRDQHPSPHALWRFNHKCRTMTAGKTLRIETLAPARVHWSTDGWQTTHDALATDTGLGIFFADLPTAKLPAGARIHFTFYWHQAGRWEGTNFDIVVE